MEIFTQFGLTPTTQQMDRLEGFYELLVSYNKRLNLTAITKREDVYIKHFLDSVSASPLLTKNASVIDIGTGAGFPSIPLLIMREDLNFLLVDSLNKRIGFLNEVKRELGLSFECVHARAEDLKCRERYDFAVSRAVAQLPTLMELTIPFVRTDGSLIAYKSVSARAEVDSASSAFRVLSCRLDSLVDFDLPDGSKRCLVVIKKLSPTHVKYPRGKNLPKKQPL